VNMLKRVRSVRTGSLMILASVCAAAPLCFGTEPVLKSDLGKKIDDYFARLVPWGFSGTLLVANDGEMILAKGYGLADRESQRPMTPDTAMSTGSITKQFTGAAILKLETAGKLKVSDPITKYFDNVPEDKRDITIHHLLTHTAGFPGAIGDDFDVSATAENFAKQAFATKLIWKPGTKYRYSNVGFSIAGIIVEKASGQSYEQYLYENLFKPAGMNRTGYLIPKYKPEELATGYRDGKSVGNIINRPWLPDGPSWHLRANGGIHSTIGDMFKWHVALEGESILPDAAKRKLFAPHVREEEGGDSFYGYGWVNVKTPRGTTVLMHNGGDGVFAADYRRYIDEKVVYCIASNTAEWSAIAASENLPRLIFGMEYTPPPPVAQVSPGQLDRCTGRYALPTGGKLVVSADAGGLILESDGADAMAAIFGGGTASKERVDKLNNRTGAILQAAGDHDYKPLKEAFGQGITLEEVTSRHTELRAEMEQELGPYKSFDVLGTVRQGEPMFTYAKLQFEHGPKYLRLRWEGDELAGIREVSGAGRRTFRPQSETEFASFELTSRSMPKISFEGPSGDAKFPILVIRAPGGDVQAKRVP